MNYFIKTCIVKLLWPQAVSDELRSTFGENAYAFQDFRIFPELGLRLHAGDLFTFTDLIREDYPYIVYIHSQTMDILNYLNSQSYVYFAVTKERLFAADTLYIYLELELNQNNAEITFESHVRESFLEKLAFDKIERRRQSEIDAQIEFPLD